MKYLKKKSDINSLRIILEKLYEKIGNMSRSYHTYDNIKIYADYKEEFDIENEFEPTANKLNQRPIIIN